MLQTKLIQGTDLPDLFGNLNLFLSTVQSEEKPVIRYHLEDLIIIVEYEPEPPRRSICCDCEYYDTTGDLRSAWGLCHKHGERIRFSHTCKSFEDNRK